MAKEWQTVKEELGKATEGIFMNCPDEIKRFNYGIMTHSDAGKHALNQYFGHWVHGYAGFMIYSSDTIDAIRQLARRPSFNLEQAKEMFAYMTKPPDREYTIAMIVKYAGQVSLGKYTDKVLAAMDSVTTKEEFIELLTAFQAYVTRLYWWFHWYFPWGVGPAMFHRRSVDDVKEMMRLSQNP